IYAHGGLNSERDAIQRARSLGQVFERNGCYPLFLVWKTGLLETLGHQIEDALRRQPARAGGFGEWFSEQTDLLLEKTVARPMVRPIWSEMKENAQLAFQSARGGDLLITALQKLRSTWGRDLEIHLVGHSAGAYVLGHLLNSASHRDLSSAFASIHLMAPACTVQFANQHYTPHAELMRRLHLYLLSDR